MKRLRAWLARIRRPRAADALELAGLAAIVLGVGMWSIPSALIIGGILLAVLANVRDLRRP